MYALRCRRLTLIVIFPTISKVMEENLQVPVSRTSLEGLSTGELIILADSFGIDIPPGLERIFIIEELLEHYNTSNQEIKDDIVVNPSYSETALLPKQYNVSYIDVIIRDPLWVFVFWEIKRHDRDIHENAPDFNGYFLRIDPLSENGKNPKPQDNSFTVPVNIEDGARYIGLAAPAGDTSDQSSSEEGCRYIIKLGVIRGSSELHIISSEPFCLPRLIENDDINDMKESPLVRLSAVADLSTTKSTDRQSKIKRQ